MLKLNEGYTVYIFTPGFKFHANIIDRNFDLVKNRLSKDEAMALTERLNAETKHTDWFCYRYMSDLEYNGCDDPGAWINDQDDYNALVSAGEIKY